MKSEPFCIGEAHSSLQKVKFHCIKVIFSFGVKIALQEILKITVLFKYLPKFAILHFVQIIYPKIIIPTNKIQI